MWRNLRDNFRDLKDKHRSSYGSRPQYVKKALMSVPTNFGLPYSKSRFFFFLFLSSVLDQRYLCFGTLFLVKLRNKTGWLWIYDIFSSDRNFYCSKTEKGKSFINQIATNRLQERKSVIENTLAITWLLSKTDERKNILNKV